MEQQITFSSIEHNRVMARTKRQVFLEEMDRIIPWEEIVAEIKPYYYKGKRGRKPIEIEIMMRMYFLQNWYNLSDEGVEEAIYESISMKNFMRLDLFEQRVPDATTLLHFRRILEKNTLCEKIFEKINIIMEEKGKMLRGGTVVDATIIEAPTSTKNKDNKRDEQMHSTKKGGQWHFGMKAHIGIDAANGMVHSVTATAANVGDVVETHKLIRKDDDVVYGDAGYQGVEKRNEIKNDECLSKKEYRICKRPGKVRQMNNNPYLEIDRHEEYLKSKKRCHVEHCFQILKCIFKFRKVCYKGIAKNLNKLFILFTSVNLVKYARSVR